MALVTYSVAPSQATDAAFRAWGKALSDALAAAGLTKLTGGESSGQIDWATVVKPAAINTSQGYEMWRFSDALHTGTTTVFIKLEYGSGAATTSPCVWFTVGAAHDGAGTLTGATTTRRALLATSNSATAYLCRVAADTNRVTFALYVDAPGVTYTILLSIERTHEASGADNGDGLLILSGYGSGAGNQIMYYAFGVGVVSTETNVPALTPSVGTGASGSAVALYPIFLTRGTYLNPMATLLVAFAANVTVGSQLSFTYYGSTKAYMPLSTTAVAIVVRGSTTGTCFLMRDE